MTYNYKVTNTLFVFAAPPKNRNLVQHKKKTVRLALTVYLTVISIIYLICIAS